MTYPPLILIPAESRGCGMSDLTTPSSPSPDEIVQRIRFEARAGGAALRDRETVGFVLGSLAGLVANAVYANDYFFAIIFTSVLVGGGLVRVFSRYRRHPGIIGIMIAYSLAGLVVLGSILAFAEYRKSILTPELHGLLIPGNEADPPAACGFTPQPPHEFMVIDVGGNIAISNTRVASVEVRGQPLLSIEKSKTGISVSARIIDKDNKVVGQITDNELWINPGNEFRRLTNDRHTFQVVDRNGDEVFFIHYRNRNHVKIRGSFYGMPPMYATDTVLVIGGAIMVANCAVPEAGGAVLRIN
jgi:hypothetical protein